MNRSPFLPGCKTDTASAADPAHPGNLVIASITFAAVFVTQTSLAQWMLHKILGCLSHCLLGARLDNCSFAALVLTPFSVVHHCSKVDFFLFVFCSSPYPSATQGSSRACPKLYPLQIVLIFRKSRLQTLPCGFLSFSNTGQ